MAVSPEFPASGRHTSQIKFVLAEIAKERMTGLEPTAGSRAWIEAEGELDTPLACPEARAATALIGGE
jgi:hypothetical protein